MRNEDLLGVPYQWRGQFPEGLDCFGLLTEVRHRCGLETPDYSWVYERWSEADFTPHHIREWVEQRPLSDPYTPGALTTRDGCRGPCLLTSDGTSAFYISPAMRVAAVPVDAVRNATWRI